jgi:hypothetical protein
MPGQKSRALSVEEAPFHRWNQWDASYVSMWRAQINSLKRACGAVWAVFGCFCLVVWLYSVDDIQP